MLSSLPSQESHSLATELIVSTLVLLWNMTVMSYAAIRWCIRITIKELISIAIGTTKSNTWNLEVLLVKTAMHSYMWKLSRSWNQCRLQLPTNEVVIVSTMPELCTGCVSAAAACQQWSMLANASLLPCIPPEHGGACVGHIVLRIAKSSLACFKGGGICPQLWNRSLLRTQCSGGATGDITWRPLGLATMQPCLSSPSLWVFVCRDPIVPMCNGA